MKAKITPGSGRMDLEGARSVGVQRHGGVTAPGARAGRRSLFVMVRIDSRAREALDANNKRLSLSPEPVAPGSIYAVELAKDPARRVEFPRGRKFEGAGTRCVKYS